MKTALEQYGADVTTVGSAKEAFEALPSMKIDMLLCDIGMPEEDGYSLIHRVRGLRTEHGSLPALALTAYARGEDRTQALRAGFDMHLAKPIDPGELLVVMETLVRKPSIRP